MAGFADGQLDATPGFGRGRELRRLQGYRRRRMETWTYEVGAGGPGGVADDEYMAVSGYRVDGGKVKV